MGGPRRSDKGSVGPIGGAGKGQFDLYAGGFGSCDGFGGWSMPPPMPYYASQDGFFPGFPPFGFPCFPGVPPFVGGFPGVGSGWNGYGAPQAFWPSGKPTKGAGKDRSKGKGKGKGKGGKSKSEVDQGKGGKGNGKRRGKQNGKDEDARASVNRRASVLSTQSFSEQGLGPAYSKLGGKLLTIPTQSSLLGDLECVKLEPTGKALAPDDFVTTGVVFCLQGLPPGQESMQEWCAAAEAARWLEIGATVMVPNMQMSSSIQAEDIAAVVDAGLKALNFDRCMIVCKDLAAARVVETAAQDLLTEGIVTGIVLVAPSSPAPDACSNLDIPVLLLWSTNDEVCSIEESEGWVEALGDRIAPTTMKECADGGHSLDVMLGSEDIAEALRCFTVSAFILTDLEEELVRQESRAEDMKAELSKEEKVAAEKSMERISRLTDELPCYLREAALHQHNGEDQAMNGHPKPQGLQLMQRRLSQDVSMFVASGFVHASE